MTWGRWRLSCAGFIVADDSRGTDVPIGAHPPPSCARVARVRAPHARRGAGDHSESGDPIRAVGALGADRVRQAEGRAAARRSRNPIRIVPAPDGGRYAVAEVCVVTLRRAGVPIHRANLARGPGQLLVIPDESRVHIAREPWERLGGEVRFVHLDLPAREFPYHYRLVATIALAEAARQIGRRAPRAAGRRRDRLPVYDRTLAMLAEDQGETIDLDDLDAY